MNSFQQRKKFIPFGVLLLFLSFFMHPAHCLIIPSDINSLGNAYQTPPPPQGSALIYGPIIFLREREAPKTELVSFHISDASGPFLIRLTNGTSEGDQRVSSAVVNLNGNEVFRPSQFNQTVSTLSRQIPLLSGENLLEVRLRSAPGSFVIIEIFRLDPQPCPVLGLHSFIRSTGKPRTEKLAFDLNPQFIEPFVLNVTSGNPDGSNRVDSATITLNGILIFGPNDFNEQVSFLSRTVSLLPTNTLSVQLRGAPGDLLTVEILGYDSIPPSVTITSPFSGATFNSSPITVTGIVDDPSSTVTVNGIAAQVASDGTFVIDGIVLVEGENPIKVVATDSCGNWGEDQISVYLKPVSQGPELILCVISIGPTIVSLNNEYCQQRAFAWEIGSIYGETDETAVSIALNDTILPDGVEIIDQGVILWGFRDGTYFYAEVRIPEIDGNHPFIAVATDANGGRTEATVTFLRDTVAPTLTVTSPSDGLVTSNPTITLAGTVDDPEAIVRAGWYGEEIPVVNGTFTTEMTLEEEVNYIEVTAMDPAWNFALVLLQIILDTIPPQINLTTPVEGEAVNTATIQVAGRIVDQNIDTISVSVNQGDPESLILTGNHFSGTVTLNPGSNTLTFHAVDKAGNTNSITRSVLLDLELPEVAITAPQPDAVLSGWVTVVAEASDALSGITSATLYVNAQSQVTLSQPPFNFTLDTSIFASGLHILTIRATDGAGNQAEASVRVMIDNTAPIVAIIAPPAGAVVTGWMSVSVQASDSHSGIASVSLYVDGQLQATLTQRPFDFPLNTILFTSGAHTLTARGIDHGGNQAEASLSILFDHVPPVVSITSPPSGATVSGTIAVTVDATDSHSGVASVSLYLNNQPHSILTQPPYSFSVDTSELTTGSHTLTVRAVDQAGNQAEESILMTVSHLRVEIISPANGATVNKSTVLVQGRIYNSEGEIGVVVNGVLAEVQGNDFAAIVPLQVGENIVTAVATTAEGLQVQTSVAIHTASQQEMIRFTVYPSSGIIKPPANTLEVTFEVEASLSNPVVSYSWDFDGDGTPEITGTEPTLIAQYQSPGLYYPRVTIMDDQGNSYTETTILNVLSKEEMDALLRSKWEGMKGALFNRDVATALDYFVDFSKEIYRQAFNLLIDELPQIISNMQDIEMIFLFNNNAKYRIKREHDIDGIRQTITYYIYFSKDTDGFWKIDRF